MRPSRRLTAVLVVVLALLAPGLVQSPAAQAATNRITGVVTVGGVPVEGVELELMQWTGAEWSYGHGADEDGVSDAAGVFSYSDLTPGTYSVTVHRRFANGLATPPTGPGTQGTVTIDADDHADLDVSLPAPVRTVTGQILKLDGTPAAGARVELGRWSAADHPSYLFSVTADGEGRYALPLYDDEPHTVTAWLPGYIRTLLGDTTRYWEAASFGIGDGPGLPTLTLQSQYVGGRVLDAAGMPVPGREVALLRWNHAQDVWVEVATATTSPAGRYVFRNTGEGHYSARIVVPAGTIHPTTGFVEPVVTGFASDHTSGPGYRWVTGSGQVADLDLTLPPPAAAIVRVAGRADVGSLLRAGTGGWGSHYQLGYRWLRDGRPIPGATGASYRLARADGLHRVRVRVTAVSSYPGLPTQQVTSSSLRVRALSVLALRVDPGRRSAVAAVRLRLPGLVASRVTHAVAVYVDGRRQTTVRLRNGSAAVTLARLSAGRHRVVVRFAGTRDHTAATASRAFRLG
ncbi:hypothetical protein GCM10025786_26640 [Nocardioides caeni]